MTHPSRFGRLSAIVLPTSLLLLAAILRFGELARNERLQPDEALYADLGRRVGLWGDWQLLNTPVDKPPLYFFTGGVFFGLVGDSEFTVRLPNAFASLISLALLYRLTYRLTENRQTAVWAGVLMVFSPFEQAFAVSGFTDTQMMLWLIASLTLLVEGRWGWSGLTFGLAVAVKPAAFWYAPLLMGMCFILPYPDFKQVGRYLLGVFLILSLISVWDRLGSLGSFWALGNQNYATGRLIRSDEVFPRWVAWGEFMGQFLPNGFLLLVGAIILRRYLRKNWQATRLNLLIWLWMGFCLAYLGLHWLVAFNVFDRYLLLILPLVLVLMAIVWQTHPILMTILGLFFLLTASPDLEYDNGIDRLAEVMNRDFAGEVFYEHWLGWELRYYLSAYPQVHLLYFATPDDLADYALAELPTIPVPRYLVAPKTEAAPWLRILKGRGLILESVYDDGKYVIFSVDFHRDATSFEYLGETWSN